MVAKARRRGYNSPHKSHGLGNVDWLVNSLKPLLEGKPKVLVMDTPAPPRKGSPRNAWRQQLVALAPGTLYGFAADTVLVSIIGAGSCVVHPLRRPARTTDLILAGMRAPLARTLLDGLYRLYRSKTHGTAHPSH